MTQRGGRRKRGDGYVEELPSGSLRVGVYAGVDPVTKRPHYVREVVKAGPGAAKEADKVLRRLASQVDEQRQPKTNATVAQMLDKYFDGLDLEPTTVDTYVGYADRHIRPLIGKVKVGRLDADVFDAFYAELRHCRAHCDRRPFMEHRINGPHECTSRCRQHGCRPLAPSTVRQIHFILSGALKKAVRWHWIGTSPIESAEPPPARKPSPQPPTAKEAARLLEQAFREPEWGTLVWLVMVTGLRRGELCGIRWRHVDLDRGTLMLLRSIAQRGRERWEKAPRATSSARRGNHRPAPPTSRSLRGACPHGRRDSG